MNLADLIGKFFHEQTVQLADETFGISASAVDFIFDFLDGELASSEYYLLFRFALERVEIDVLTGNISYSRATAEDIEDFANRLIYNNPKTVSEPGSTVSALWSFNF